MNEHWIFGDDDEDGVDQSSSPLTVDKILAVEQTTSLETRPAVRGKLKKGGETHSINVRMNVEDFAAMMRCVISDARFAGMYADFVRDAIIDRIDKHVQMYDNPAFAAEWQRWTRLRELEEMARNTKNYLDELESLYPTVQRARQIGDMATIERMRQIAEEIYLSAPPRARDVIKMAFPEIGG